MGIISACKNRNEPSLELQHNFVWSHYCLIIAFPQFKLKDLNWAGPSKRTLIFSLFRSLRLSSTFNSSISLFLSAPVILAATLFTPFIHSLLLILLLWTCSQVHTLLPQIASHLYSVVLHITSQHEQMDHIPGSWIMHKHFLTQRARENEERERTSTRGHWRIHSSPELCDWLEKFISCFTGWMPLLCLCHYYCLPAPLSRRFEIMMITLVL